MINAWDSSVFENFKENKEVTGRDKKRVVQEVHVYGDEINQKKQGTNRDVKRRSSS